jgi:hypothetical protein
VSLLLSVTLALTQIPTVSAHGSNTSPHLDPIHGVLVVVAGLGTVAIAVVLRRRARIATTVALSGVLMGLFVAVAGTILFDGLSPDPTYTASTMPFQRSWYQSIGMVVGLSITVLSLIVGLVRWPTRPRYMSFGILAGAWIVYPYLLPGGSTRNHLGYALVLGLPVLVGYILWKDTWGVLHSVLRDRISRRFGIGTSAIAALFFMSTTGYLSFFWEAGVPRERIIVVLPVEYQLVQWPTLEVVLPSIPLVVALSGGIVAVVGLLSVLVGLNAAVFARQWQLGEGAGVVQSTAGSGGVLGICTCGCCGPLVAKISLLAAGPAISAPLYWVFVDTSSPLSTLFIVASVILFTGTLVYTADSTQQATAGASIQPAD